MKTSIVFFGTPRFAAEILKFLAKHGVTVVGVVTQPDRPKGRSDKPVFSAVKEAAIQCLPQVPILQPEKASQENFLEQLGCLRGDLYVVVAYGQILSEKLLSQSPKGCINVHASLLPKYRGAAPIHRCLMAGEKETGISIQKMVKQLDAGDVIATSKMQIPIEMNLGELEGALCEISKSLLLQVITEYDEKIPSATPQDHTLATYASKVDPVEGEIHWGERGEKIHDLIRSFSPRPGAWAWLESQKEKIKIYRAQLVSDKNGIPGQILCREDGLVACGQGGLRILEVQSEGKRPMSWEEWIRGKPQFLKFPV